MLCRLLFVLLSFFYWLLCCLSFFDFRILVTSLVSSNSSYSLYKSISMLYLDDFNIRLLYHYIDRGIYRLNIIYLQISTKQQHFELDQRFWKLLQNDRSWTKFVAQSLDHNLRIKLCRSCYSLSFQVISWPHKLWRTNICK